MSLGHSAGRRRASFDQVWIDRGAPSPTKGALVEFYGNAVQCDRTLDCLGRKRYAPTLISITQHEKVARNRITEEAGGEAGRIQELGVARSGRVGDAALQRTAG